MSSGNSHLITLVKAMALSVQTVVRAEELWRTLGSPENHKEFQDQFNTYIPFFNCVRANSLDQTLIGLARFSDKQKPAAKAERLLSLLGRAGYSNSQIDPLMASYQAHADVWPKIKVLRDQVLAHTSASESEQEAFHRAEVTYDQISAAVAASREVMMGAARLVGAHDSVIFESRNTVAWDANKLLRNLKAGNAARMKLSSTYGIHC